MNKVLCPVCNEIIEVSDDHKEEVYCPKCFKHINVETGAKALAVYINKQKEAGTTNLYEATEYYKAIKCFQTVLDATPLDEEAAEGLVISTIRTSTIRYCAIKEAAEEMQRNLKAFENANNDVIAGFLKVVLHDLDYYVETLKDRLMNNETFYEQQGKDLFINAIKDAIYFKEVVVDQVIMDRRLPERFGVSKKKTQNEISYLKGLLKGKYPIESSPFHLLNTDVKECCIEDLVFRDVRSLYKYRKIMLIWNAISLGILGIGIALIFILPKYLLIGVPTTSIGFVLTVIFTILNFRTLTKINNKN